MLRRALVISVVVSTLGWSVAGPAASEEEPEASEPNFANNGTYLQAGGTNGVEVFRDIEPNTGDSAVGFNLRWGRRSNKRIAVEGEFEYLNDFGLQSWNEPTRSFDAYALSMNAKLFALTDRVQPYALLGIGALITAGSGLDEIGFMARMGGGLDVWITESLGVSLEAAYVLPTGRTKNYDYVAVAWSLVYRFAIDDEEDY